MPLSNIEIFYTEILSFFTFAAKSTEMSLMTFTVRVIISKLPNGCIWLSSLSSDFKWNQLAMPCFVVSLFIDFINNLLTYLSCILFSSCCY